MGTDPRVRLPGGWEDGYLCSPTARTVQCRSRTYTQMPPGKRPYSCANLDSAHAAHNVTGPTGHGWHCFLYPDQISEQQTKEQGQKDQIASFRGSPGNIKGLVGTTEGTVAGLLGQNLVSCVPLHSAPGGPERGRNSSGRSAAWFRNEFRQLTLSSVMPLFFLIVK